MGLEIPDPCEKHISELQGTYSDVFVDANEGFIFLKKLALAGVSFGSFTQFHSSKLFAFF